MEALSLDFLCSSGFHISGAKVLVGNLTFNLVFGAICALIAGGKGRNWVGWFVVGALTSCIGLIIVCCLSDLKSERTQQTAQAKDTRLIKERVDQERHRNDAFQSHVLGRLDAHDMSLGIDTREIKGPLDLPGPAKAIAETPEWYYDDHGQPAGPISRSALVTLLSAGAFESSTVVWRDGMSDWAPIRDVDELSA